MPKNCECGHAEQRHKWSAAECVEFGCPCNKYVEGRTDAQRLVGNAALRFLDDTEHLPTTEPSRADIVEMAVAWLDFYDAVWPVVAEVIGREDIAFGSPGDIQESLLELAKDLRE